MRKSLSLIFLMAAAVSPAFAADAPATGVKNIVIVPGAFVDGSGWHVVHDILIHKGYTVNVVQPRVDSLANDVEAVYRQLRKEDGPTLLVGSDYGGAVITQAGTRDKVKGLVYVAAVAPSIGESTLQLVNSVSEPSNDFQTSFDGYIYIDQNEVWCRLWRRPNHESHRFSVRFAGSRHGFRIPCQHRSRRLAQQAQLGCRRNRRPRL